jgi:DNA-directed RNA polymerase specialized sigma24 family protein
MGREAETELARRAARGDAAAFAELFEWCFTRVHAFARRRARAEAGAEALTERILTRVCEELGSRDEALPLAVWVLRIALREAGDPAPGADAEARRDPRQEGDERRLPYGWPGT